MVTLLPSLGFSSVRSSSSPRSTTRLSSLRVSSSSAGTSTVNAISYSAV